MKKKTGHNRQRISAPARLVSEQALALLRSFSPLTGGGAAPRAYVLSRKSRRSPELAAQMLAEAAERRVRRGEKRQGNYDRAEANRRPLLDNLEMQT